MPGLPQGSVVAGQNDLAPSEADRTPSPVIVPDLVTVGPNSLSGSPGGDSRVPAQIVGRVEAMPLVVNVWFTAPRVR